MPTQVDFEFDFHGNNLRILADVTPGRPARINCLPEHAEPAESPTIEYVEVKLVDAHGVEVDLDPVGLGYWDRYQQRYRSLEEELDDFALAQIEDEAA